MAMDQLFQQLESLRSEIRSRRAEIEQARHLPLDLVDRLRATGIFSLSVPRAFGGRGSRSARHPAFNRNCSHCRRVGSAGAQ